MVSGLAVLGVVVLAFFFFRSGSPKNAALAGREKLMETLGARIAKVRPKSKVLVLSNPFTRKAGTFDEKSQFERAGIRGLEEGLGDGSEVTVVFPEIRPEYFSNPESVIIPPDTRTPLSFLIQPGSVDQLAEAHPQCQVVVSLIGLPMGVERLKIWDQKDSRSFALLLPDLRLLGSPTEVVAAFQRGKLLAAVFEDTKSGDPLLVTQENILQVLKEKPQVLGY